ncbi:MAG: RluA family pseudouridine synthase [Elusimicrobia bacterium]|nr:RluA family pseudouridine synthase [Elusimicrobiota bacterium]
MSAGPEPVLIQGDLPGMRLDRFLVERLPGYSRSDLKDFIERGLVSVNGGPARADYRLKGGEAIEILVLAGGWPEIENFESWVIAEDRDILVLNKPSGLLMHPLGTSWLSAPEAALAEREPNLAGILQRERPGILAAGVARCGIVHRLDRQTSGVLLVAKSPRAQEGLLSGFKERLIRKYYRAIVRGAPKSRKSKISAPIGRKPGHRRILVTPFGKAAQTEISVLKSATGASLVEAKPLTGRTHQIRAHLAFLGHPVMGDPEHDAPAAGEPAPARTMLHAYRIELEHPGTGRLAVFTAPLPRDFLDFWRTLSGR